MLVQLLSVVQITLGGFFGLNSWNGVSPTEPAVKIHLGAAGRTEGMKFLQGGLAADGTGPARFEADRIDHQTTAEAVVIQE